MKHGMQPVFVDRYRSHGQPFNWRRPRRNALRASSTTQPFRPTPSATVSTRRASRRKTSMLSDDRSDPLRLGDER